MTELTITPTNHPELQALAKDLGIAEIYWTVHPQALTSFDVTQLIWETGEPFGNYNDDLHIDWEVANLNAAQLKQARTATKKKWKFADLIAYVLFPYSDIWIPNDSGNAIQAAMDATFVHPRPTEFEKQCISWDYAKSLRAETQRWWGVAVDLYQVSLTSPAMHHINFVTELGGFLNQRLIGCFSPLWHRGQPGEPVQLVNLDIEKERIQHAAKVLHTVHIFLPKSMVAGLTPEQVKACGEYLKMVKEAVA